MKERSKRQAQLDLDALLKLAAERTPKDMRVARSAAREAFRLSQRNRLRMPLIEKRKLCKHCFTYLKPGVTSTVRIAKGRIIITCNNCRHIKRLQYRRGA